MVPVTPHTNIRTLLGALHWICWVHFHDVEMTSKATLLAMPHTTYQCTKCHIPTNMTYHHTGFDLSHDSRSVLGSLGEAYVHLCCMFSAICSQSQRWLGKCFTLVHKHVPLELQPSQMAAQDLHMESTSSLAGASGFQLYVPGIPTGIRVW
jgi:hypothetical protein